MLLALQLDLYLHHIDLDKILTLTQALNLLCSLLRDGPAPTFASVTFSTGTETGIGS